MYLRLINNNSYAISYLALSVVVFPFFMTVSCVVILFLTFCTSIIEFKFAITLAIIIMIIIAMVVSTFNLLYGDILLHSSIRFNVSCSYNSRFPESKIRSFSKMLNKHFENKLSVFFYLR